MEHRPAWNNLVHCRIRQEAIEFRNITLCRTLEAFQDLDPTLREKDNANYGIFPQVYAAIRRLEVWVGEDFRRWWLRTVELPAVWCQMHYLPYYRCPLPKIDLA